MVSPKKHSTKRTVSKARSKNLKSRPKTKEVIAKHKSKVIFSACIGLLLYIGYLSMSQFLPAAAETASISWTSGDPTFSVDPDQSKIVPSYCSEEQVVLGNDVEPSNVCVVKRDTWRYGKYSRDVCRWSTCSLEQGYAIGFGDDTKMYRMRDMPEFWAPYLVPGSNIMAVRDSHHPYYSLGIIKDFQLQFNETIASDGSKEYTYNGSPYYKFETPNGTRVKVQSVGASSNGKWLVAEAPDVGLFRINLDTLEVRRFSALVFDYWTGANPTMEFAVSNDGNSVAAMGYNTIFTTYSVNDTCGDSLTDTLSKSDPIPSPCTQKDMAAFMAGKVEGFQYGFSPSFDENAGMLSMQAYYQSSGATGVKWVTLSFATAPDAGDGNCLMTSEIGSTTDPKCCVTNRSYPYIVREMMGKQAAKMKVSCAGTGGSTDATNLESWKAWQTECLNLETTVQDECKGITFEEFMQMYKGGTLKEVASGR